MYKNVLCVLKNVYSMFPKYLLLKKPVTDPMRIPVYTFRCYVVYNVYHLHVHLFNMHTYQIGAKIVFVRVKKSIIFAFIKIFLRDFTGV